MFQYSGHKYRLMLCGQCYESFCVQSHGECLAIAVCVHHMLSLIIVLYIEVDTLVGTIIDLYH